MKEKAWFVFRPRTAADLTLKNPAGKWREYRIVKTICLDGIDYENFITDMIADRQFIEDNAALCSQGETWRCIFVQRRGRTGGVLVVPADSCHIGWAAALSDKA